MKTILLIIMLSSAFSAVANEATESPKYEEDKKARSVGQLNSQMDAVKAGLIKDIDIKNLCVAIASGGAYGTVRDNLSYIQRKYKFSDTEMMENIIEGSFCKIDGVVRSIAGAALFSEITDFEVIIDKYNFSKHDRIDVGFGHGLENVMTMIRRELRAKNTPNYVKGIMKKVARILVKEE